MSATAEITSELLRSTARTAHLRAEVAGEADLPELHTVVDQAPCGVMLLDASGDIAFANRRVAELFGLPRANTFGLPLRALICDSAAIEPLLTRMTDPRAAHLRHVGEARMVLTGRRADGSEFPLEVHLSSVRDAARCWALAVLRDATEQCRILEELREARREAEAVARTKGEFLSFAAHDLTQPVQALELAIDSIAQHSPESAKLTELTMTARLSVERMRELLKALLEISRLESGAVRVVEEPVQIAEMFAYLERQFGAAARAKGLDFEAQLSGEVIRTDATLLRGMLGNLVSNAIRYTPSGQVRLQTHPDGNGSLDLEICDTGVGIPSRELEGIFDDFHRLDDARRIAQEGFGLGLGIVRRLSQVLGMPVTVRSTVGRGSTFCIRIPASKVLTRAE